MRWASVRPWRHQPSGTGRYSAPARRLPKAVSVQVKRPSLLAEDAAACVMVRGETAQGGGAQGVC
jgi:hypothetical protein